MLLFSWRILTYLSVDVFIDYFKKKIKKKIMYLIVYIILKMNFAFNPIYKSRRIFTKACIVNNKTRL